MYFFMGDKNSEKLVAAVINKSVIPWEEFHSFKYDEVI